ncbi:MAG: hypothetical protein ACXVW6_03800 [Nocardioidaceae bacterium]
MRSSTEAGAPGRPWALKAVTDVGALMRFRGSMLRGRSRRGAQIGFAVIGLITLVCLVLPAFYAEPRFPRGEVALILPTTYVSVLVISVVSAVASGGGRELLAREQAVAFPVSPVTDHLGALLMAPLNIAWLLQSWTMLAVTAYAVGPSPRLLAAQLPVLLWLATATAVAQVLAWIVEWVRRGPHGILLVRLGALGGALLLGWLIVEHRLVPLLDASPTLRIALAALQSADGTWTLWWTVLVQLVLLTFAAVVLGAFVNRAVARRPARDELRQESSVRPPRPHPASDLVAVLRVDRASVWRSVPLRRGLAVLALLPGLVALASGLGWDMLCLMPGLVASGGALLFGVNVFCLDGRGALWRDSLPAPPQMVFVSRVVVLAEVLLVAIAATLLMGALRAGLPTAAQALSVLCAALVVTFQVVSASVRWSVRRPYAVDLRGARATPAPPLVMVGYSTRLALATTFTGLVFATTTLEPGPWAPLIAGPFLLLSLLRLVRTSRAWADPDVRARVVATVAS